MEKREIKFRAWDNHNKKMCQPYYEIKVLETNVCSIEHSPTGGYYMTDIMQFTGLVDKNNKEIFESDILKHGDEILVVNWHKEFASFVLNKKGWAFSHFFQEGANAENCEVIGNIYETPNL